MTQIFNFLLGRQKFKFNDESSTWHSFLTFFRYVESSAYENCRHIFGQICAFWPIISSYSIRFRLKNNPFRSEPAGLFWLCAKRNRFVELVILFWYFIKGTFKSGEKTHRILQHYTEFHIFTKDLIFLHRISHILTILP